MSKELVKAISEIQEDEAIRLVEETIKKGGDLEGILRDCQEAMNIVGQRYEKGEYFLPELIMSGEMLRKISELVKPKLGLRERKVPPRKRRVVSSWVRLRAIFTISVRISSVLCWMSTALTSMTLV